MCVSLSAKFRNSRTLPGQEWASIAAMAEGANPGKSMRISIAMRRAKWSARSEASPLRARRGGRVITSNASRSRRSARKPPLRTRDGRSTFVAATTRTSVVSTFSPPSLWYWPYSTTRSSFSCTRLDAVAISSRNKVPPSASSNRPARRSAAPVKAPRSCPNSSESSSSSDSAAQLTLMNGPSHRLERKCNRSPISSLPVPRSPMSRSGLSSGATRLACSSASSQAGASPIN